MAGLLENKANLNSSFSLVEVEVWVELGNTLVNYIYIGLYSFVMSIILNHRGDSIPDSKYFQWGLNCILLHSFS